MLEEFPKSYQIAGYREEMYEMLVFFWVTCHILGFDQIYKIQ